MPGSYARVHLDEVLTKNELSPEDVRDLVASKVFTMKDLRVTLKDMKEIIRMRQVK